MADVGGAEERNARAFTPVARDILCPAPERTIVFWHVAHSSEADAGNPTQMLRHVEEQAVYRVEVFRHFLHHHHVLPQLGHQLGAAQHGESHEIEGYGRRLVEGRLQTRSEEHTSELQSRENLVCRLL